MAEDATPAPRPDSSSFVEHLRFVHFTLIAACIITMIAITSQESSSASRAYEQTKQIQQIAARWQSGQWIKDFVDRKVPDLLQREGVPNRKRDEMGLELVAFDPVDPPRTVISNMDLTLDGVRLLYNDWSLAELAHENRKSIDRDLRSTKSEPTPNFDNLDGAIKIWTLLYHFRYLVLVKNILGGWYSANDNLVNYTVNLVVNEAPTRGSQGTAVGIGAKLLLRQELVEILRGRADSPRFKDYSELHVQTHNDLFKRVSDDEKTQCYLFGPVRAPLVEAALTIVRAECITLELPLQSSLVDGLSPAVLRFGEFARSFPDVDDLAKQISSLSLGQLERFFESEKNRVGEKIEFPGVKLPGEAVTTWGIVILLSLLGYFAVTYRDFSLRVALNDKARDVPWIGISQDIAARIAFLVSILFALCTVGYLAGRGAYARNTVNAWCLYATASFVAIVAVLFIVRYWHKSLATWTSNESERTRQL